MVHTNELAINSLPSNYCCLPRISQASYDCFLVTAGILSVNRYRYMCRVPIFLSYMFTLESMQHYHHTRVNLTAILTAFECLHYSVQ